MNKMEKLFTDNFELEYNMSIYNNRVDHQNHYSENSLIKGYSYSKNLSDYNDNNRGETD